MEYNNEIAGIIYPLTQSNLDRLLTQKNPIYIKFLTSAVPTSTRLHKGHHLFLYLSKMSKSIEFYSKIKNISFKLPLEIKKNNINNIQMDETELDILKVEKEKHCFV